MSTLRADTGARAAAVEITGEELKVSLVDGRIITVPLAWFPRLNGATPEQRSNWEFVGEGEGIHWPDIDEDLSVSSLLKGARAPRGAR
jgi:hypothetical protein